MMGHLANHLPVLPVLLPLVAAIILAALHAAPLRWHRSIALAVVLIMIPVAGALIARANTDAVLVYALGNWPAPYGIVLVVDRLAALLLGVVAVLAVPVVIYAVNGADSEGRHFHALVQLQIAGLNGAFLTGDLFNLFVFFEVLLLASYGLLTHGRGLDRAAAGLAYVVLNLTGSLLFLVALALIYGTLGTLNLADVAVVLNQVPDGNGALVRAAFALLLVVFALKAALLPLSFWLPHAYGAASAPVAALFSIMTKVGVYALLRVSSVAFPSAPFTADLLQPWLVPIAIATITLGTFGALAAVRLAVVIANLVMVSTGTVLLAIAVPGAAALTAAIYYLIHTVLVLGAFFLLCGMIAAGRGEARDRLIAGPPLPHAATTGALYLILAIAVCGVPPLSGFVGKIMIMQSIQAAAWAWAGWTALLLSSFLPALVLARAASVLFWEPSIAPPRSQALCTGWPAVAVALLLLASPLLSAGASSVAAYARATAEQIGNPRIYINAVLGDGASPRRDRRP